METITPDLLKLLLAVLAGALIGAEREFRDKSAGFRTLILICVGAALFTLLSIRIGGSDDNVRIAANIVSGVGFLGAGAILRDGSRVTGLTTAAMIWLVAALGMGIGGGFWQLSLFTLALILVVLFLFPLIEHRIDRLRDSRTYELTCDLDAATASELDVLFAASGLEILDSRRTKQSGTMVLTWQTKGSPARHKALAEKLFALEHVRELRC
jgi:putative Mg2+ transporter-C (MgtC) family protein